MKVVIDVRKSLEENAQGYFQAAQKARRKAKGAAEALAAWKAKPDVEKRTTEKKKSVVKERHEWYEGFRWCIGSDGTLFVGGRDATTNETLIKHHAEKGDVVFHTDMAGSPFVVVKAGGKPVSGDVMEEAAQFCASYSRAWGKGLASLEVFHVKPEQVTKEAQAGEHLAKGAFMIRGKTIYHTPRLAVAVGVTKQGKVFAGPPSAVRAHCKKVVEVFQGNEKASDVAKQLRERLGGGTVDSFVAVLPSGGVRLARDE